MAIDFSSLGATPAKTGKIDFTALGAVPAVGQEEPTDETTALGALGRGAASMVPLGTQALAGAAGVLQNEPYLQERQEIEKETQADIANHPVARLAGQGAGIALPALVTGGASAPESLLGAAGQGAAIGAGFGAGNALDTLASGGSGAQAAGQVALGAGLGAAGGAVGQKLAEFTQPLTKGLTEMANEKAVQAANLRPGVLGLPENELQDLGQKIHEWNLVTGDTGERLLKSQVLLNKIGGSIGDMGAGAQPLADTTPYVQNLLDKAAENSKIDAPEFQNAAKMYTAGANAIKSLERPSTVAQTSMLRADETGKAVINPILPSLETKPVTFDELSQLKQTFGEQAFDANGEVKNKAAADVYGQIKTAMKSIVDNSPEQYQDAMDNYGALKDISSGLRRQLQLEQAQGAQARGIGMAGRLMAVAGKQPLLNVGAAAALAPAHPFLAASALTPILMNPQAMSTLARQGATAIPKIAGALPAAGAQIASGPTYQNMGETKPVDSVKSAQSETSGSPSAIDINNPALAKWKPIFQKNAQNAKTAAEAQKSNAVTDFVLSQRDPSYAEAKQKMSELSIPAPTATDTTKMAQGGAVMPKAVYTSGQNEPINPLADKLKDYLKNRKEKDNGGA